MKHLVAAGVILSAMLGACATTPTGGQDAFGACPQEDGHPELAGSVCTVQSVALNQTAPEGERIGLFVRKFPARAERAGEIWMLAGGPGEAGTSFYTKIADFRARFPGFDILIPDHRGTGRSAHLCSGETLQSEAGTALAGSEFGPCFGEIWAQSERTMQFSMTHAAHDLDTLIARLGGEGERWVYAVSYGTGLALRFGQLHEASVDGLILDSLVPALDDTQYDLSHRSHTVDLVGRRVLAACAADPACNGRFEGGIEAEYARLLADIAAGHRDDIAETLPGGNLRHTLGTMLDVPAARALIPEMIDIAIDRPQALGAFYTGEVVPAFAALSAVSDYEGSAFSITLAGLIGVSETNRRPEMTADAVAAEEAGLWFTSPLTQLQTRTSMPAYPRDEWFDAPYADLPPVLVVHGTLDPKTTLEGAERHIAALEAGGTDITLVTVERAPHASWFFAPDCLYDSMEDFIEGDAVAERCTPASMQ
ncbi:alpha/beta fold hydrolase [Maricaulis sp.]|uniref:alpha/beta fold hydrolase n=1 Tax=Maricaulis sp. TaxID=1486257 RepID=UPI0032989C23